MDSKAAANADLAHRVCVWLQARGCTVQVLFAPPYGYEVHYTLKNDVKPQPAVKVDGSIRFPVGSQEDVVLAFLLDQ